MRLQYLYFVSNRFEILCWRWDFNDNQFTMKYIYRAVRNCVGWAASCFQRSTYMLLYIGITVIIVTSFLTWANFRFYITNNHRLPFSVSKMVAIARATRDGNINYEQRAELLLSEMPNSKLRNGTLCATFLSWDEKYISILESNIQKTHNFCKWFVIVYNSYGLSEDDMTFELLVRLNVSDGNSPVSIKIAPSKDISPQYFRDICLDYTNNGSFSLVAQCELAARYSRSSYNPHLHSKASLMVLLLPYLPYYEYCWVMDSDMSLHNMDILKFQQIHRCAFNMPPLVTQPLIQEPTQFYRYLYRGNWKNTSILASGVGFVELQVIVF